MEFGVELLVVEVLALEDQLFYFGVVSSGVLVRAVDGEWAGLVLLIPTAGLQVWRRGDHATANVAEVPV